MIKSIYFKSLRTAEFIQYIADFLKLIEQCNIAKLKSLPFVSELIDKSKELDRSMGQNGSNKFTKEMKKQDKRRDKAISCLRGIIYSYRNHFDNTKQNASEILLKKIDQYGKDIGVMNYQAQTGILSAISDELINNDKLSAYTRLLHVDDVVQEMQEANEAFRESFLLRINDESRNKTLSTTELIKTTTPVYKELISSIEAYARIFPSSDMNKLISATNVLIDMYMLEVKKRRGRKNST